MFMRWVCMGVEPVIINIVWPSSRMIMKEEKGVEEREEMNRFYLAIFTLNKEIERFWTYSFTIYCQLPKTNFHKKISPESLNFLI
jgi:hypothetical protein